MKAVSYADGKVRFNANAPTPKGEGVLVDIVSAGICGSDLHFYRSSPDELGVCYGKIVGHEPAGIVIQTGNAVSKFKVGDRVTVNHTLGYGHCQYCHQR